MGKPTRSELNTEFNRGVEQSLKIVKENKNKYGVNEYTFDYIEEDIKSLVKATP